MHKYDRTKVFHFWLIFSKKPKINRNLSFMYHNYARMEENLFKIEKSKKILVITLHIIEF